MINCLVLIFINKHQRKADSYLMLLFYSLLEADTGEDFGGEFILEPDSLKIFERRDWEIELFKL